jgi:hypothetical protein
MCPLANNCAIAAWISATMTWSEEIVERVLELGDYHAEQQTVLLQGEPVPPGFRGSLLRRAITGAPAGHRLSDT